MSQFKLFFLFTFLSLVSILQSEAQTLNDYPWINSVVDQQNCCFNENIQLYSFGTFEFIYIANDVGCAGEGGTLFSSDGTVWCMSTPGFDCLSFYSFTFEGDLFDCGQSSEFDLLNTYPWLENVVNEEDCCDNSTVSLYQNELGHQYFLVSPDPSCSSANEKWYFSTGQLFCESGPNYDCVSLYGFDDMKILATWNCGEGSGQELTVPENLTISDEGFFPEDIVIVNNVAYVSGLGDGTVRSFDLTQANPTAELFAAAEAGYTQAWGLKSDGTVLLSLLDNADFTGGAPGPSKLVQYDIASGAKTAEWDLPENTIGHTVSIVDGKYYVTDFGTPQIFEVDPSTGTVSLWFTSPDWDPTISGIGGTIYNNDGAFYVSQGNKLWYLPISGGTPGTLQEVSVSGLDVIDADGISWSDSDNTLYYATNDTGDPANVGTAYKLVFSDATTATGSVVATGFDDSSGLWYYENDGSSYVFVLESQFGALFGLNSYEPPFTITIIDLASIGSGLPQAAGDNVTVYNSFEDATLTGGQQGFFGAEGPVVVTDASVEFPGFIGFYDIDVNDCGLTMTLIDNSGASSLLLPDGRFDRYYFGFDSAIMPNVSVLGGSPGLTVNVSVTPLPAGYTVPVDDLFGTGYPLPITLPNGGFVLELGGGTDLTELGQTVSVNFGCPETAITLPENLTISDEGFFPEDIVIANNVAYVSGLGDGTIRSFDLTQANPTAELFAAAEAGYTQAWGLKSDGTVLLSLLDNADFTGNPPGPSKLVQYDIASGTKTAEWDLPAGTIGHTVSIVDGKYYVTDFGTPRIMEIDPSTGTVNDSWFTSPDWDPSISGIGGTIYDNEGGFYVSQGNKLWYLPISNGTPGTLQEVTVAGLDIIDADGISWVDSQNTLYYATNDTGDPANVGTAYKLVFSDATTATGSVVVTGLDDSSGLWYYENDGNEYVFVLESQFGALFGLNSFEPPFNIEIISVN